MELLTRQDVLAELAELEFGESVAVIPFSTPIERGYIILNAAQQDTDYMQDEWLWSYEKGAYQLMQHRNVDRTRTYEFYEYLTGHYLGVQFKELFDLMETNDNYYAFFARAIPQMDNCEDHIEACDCDIEAGHIMISKTMESTGKNSNEILRLA